MPSGNGRHSGAPVWRTCPDVLRTGGGLGKRNPPDHARHWVGEQEVPVGIGSTGRKEGVSKKFAPQLYGPRPC